MRLYPRPRLDTRKVLLSANILNFIELFALLGMILLTLLDVIEFSAAYMRPMIVLLCLLLMIDNLVGLRNGVFWQRFSDRFSMLRDALDRVENLNRELRTQRHDFMNHLQVVYSLIEMQEPEEAIAYIEKVHGDMQSRSLAVQTARPAINALLQAKLGDCKKRGIRANVQVSSSWKLLSIPEWEMCRVLGNIIDNAMDALQEVTEKQLTIELFEGLNRYGFRIINNGPMISRHVQEHLFDLGFTTKQTGQGLGLSIVKTILEENGGSISVSSTAEQTVFTGDMPISSAVKKTEEPTEP